MWRKYRRTSRAGRPPGEALRAWNRSPPSSMGITWGAEEGGELLDAVCVGYTVDVGVCAGVCVCVGGEQASRPVGVLARWSPRGLQAAEAPAPASERGLIV